MKVQTLSGVVVKGQGSVKEKTVLAVPDDIDETTARLLVNFGKAKVVEGELEEAEGFTTENAPVGAKAKK